MHHKYEKLNYYTHTLHEHFMRDAREEARRKRDEEKLAQLRSSAPAVQHDKALVLQRIPHLRDLQLSASAMRRHWRRLAPARSVGRLCAVRG